MSAPLRDPKELTEWLELDYFRRPRGLRRWTRRLGWAALGLTAAFVAFTLWPRQHTIYEAGPVSAGHALFNDRCEVCHAAPFQTAARFWPPSGNARSVPDANCLQCHAGPHHNPMMRDDEANCAACHREHRGHAPLARVPDAHCTACHADLVGQYPGTPLKKVRDFTPAGHPPFRWWKGDDDPGTIAFNHKVHLAEQGVKMPGRSALKKLDCRDCHQPDEASRYMKPIRYEQHCKECHPLAVRVTGALKTPALLQEAARFGANPAPHDRPEVVRGVLRDRYAELGRRFKHDLFGLPEAAEPETAPALPWRPAPPPASKQEWDWTQDQLHQAEQVLFTHGGGCAYCHTPTRAWKSGKGPGGLPEYAPSQINRRTFPRIGESDRWLPQSSFNHHAHRMLNCAECHKAKTSERTADVLLPAINNCMSCHNPRAGARSDCAECHQYHPRAGRDVWRGRRTIHESIGAGHP
jgi:hypothetical protein